MSKFFCYVIKKSSLRLAFQSELSNDTFLYVISFMDEDPPSLPHYLQSRQAASCLATLSSLCLLFHQEESCFHRPANVL